MSSTKNKTANMNRRDFLRSTTAAGASLALAPVVFSQGPQDKPDDINVALLGAGRQGQTLLAACHNIPGVRFRAVCDIWTQYSQRIVVGRLNNRYKVQGYDPVNAYTDYREMLEKEKAIDAVIVATPDFWHADHTVASLEAGKHVYCEKEMSNTLEGARKIVRAAKESGKLLQIGHQRRSNPRYLFALDKIIKEANLLGRVTTVNGQWNRSKSACGLLEVARRYYIDEDILQKYGYKSMTHFLNWRLYKGLGGGPIVDLGSHQIDVYNWFLQAQPKSIIASGGTDYWSDWEWYDNVMAIYEYDTAAGPVRAFYQTHTTTGSKGYFENFMGDQGTLDISENKAAVYREVYLLKDAWDKWIKKGYLTEPADKDVEVVVKEEGAELNVAESPPAPKYDFTVVLDKPFHQPHLENFFDAIRGQAQLNCPAEDGYQTAVTVLKVNEAVAAGKTLEFKPEDFKVED
ncbi:Gfo/Idh/MocA family oxidoreductase [Planctomycetota bacterium]